MGALLVLIALAVFATMMITRPQPPTQARLPLALPATIDPFSLAISPDAQSVVFAAPADDGRRLLWVRRLDTGVVRSLRGTDNGHHPFWSPDSRAIGFASSGQLKRIDLESDGVRKLANAPLFLGGTWNREGVILFVPSTNAGVFRVSADNPGKPVLVTPAIPDGQASAPCFIPGTDRFLFYATSSQARKWGASTCPTAEGSEVRRLFDADTSAVYAPSGHILFGLKGALYARPFDAAQLQLTGEPVQLADGMMVRRFAGVPVAALSVADTGQILYRTGTAGSERFQLGWFDRSGTTPMTPLPDPRRSS